MNEEADNQVISSSAESDPYSLLSSPEVLSKIGNVLSRHGIISEEENREHSPPIDDSEHKSSKKANLVDNEDASSTTLNNFENSDVLQKLPAIMSLFSSSGAGASMLDKQQNDLLGAIRPYLSTRRREVLDSLLRFERIGATIKKLTQGEKNVSQ